MSTTTKTYNVNQIKQLIELNGNLTNFSADFIIESRDFIPFKALIISETDLNSGNPIVYQEVKDGKINGNITNDKDVYDSYFILLKSDVPTECQVTIDLKEVSLNPEIIRYQEELEQQKKDEERIRQLNEHKRQQEEEYFKSNKNKNKEVKKKNIKCKTNWFLILGFAAIVCVGIWYILKKKKSKSIDGHNGSINISPVTVVKKLEPLLELPSLPVLENPLPQVPILEHSLPKSEIVSVIPDISTEIPKLVETPSIVIKKNVDLVDKINNFFGK